MTARAAVYELLVGDTELSADGITVATIFPSNATDDPPRNTPFLFIRWAEQTPRWGMSGQPGKTRMELWAHDHGGSYVRINRILQRCKEILDEAIHVTGADGYVLTQANWRGASPDLVDDGYKTLTRNHGYEVVSRKAT